MNVAIFILKESKKEVEVGLFETQGKRKDILNNMENSEDWCDDIKNQKPLKIFKSNNFNSAYKKAKTWAGSQKNLFVVF